MRQRIAAHPVLAFVLLAYGFSYLVGGPFMMALQAVLPWSRAPLGSYLARALVVFGPAFAALVVTRATSGRAGIARLLGRFRLRRSDLPYVLALPLVALGVTAGGYLLAGVPLDVLGDRLLRFFPLLLTHFALSVLVVGVAEETGWRGWLLPALLSRYRPLVASGVLAAAWGLWHAPALVSSVRGAMVFLLGVLALTLLFTRLWTRTCGSLAILALAHGSFNAPIMFFESVLPPGRGGAAWEWTVLLYAVAALLLLLATWRWWLTQPSDDAGQTTAPAVAAQESQAAARALPAKPGPRTDVAAECGAPRGLRGLRTPP